MSRFIYSGYNAIKREQLLKNFQKRLQDIRWAPLEGEWSAIENGLAFSGFEFGPAETENSTSSSEPITSRTSASKFTAAGTVVFGQHFQEGRIKIQVEFEETDHRCLAGIMLQYNLETKDMLIFSISGGGLKFEPGVAGYLFRLQTWGPKPDQTRQQQGNLADRPETWPWW